MRSRKTTLAWAAAALVAALVVAALFLGEKGTMTFSQPPGQVTRLSPTEIEFTATVTAASFDRRFPMPGYHAVVWRGGGAAHAALFRADVTDVQVLDALEALGAKPGDALGMATWDERKDAASKAPDQVIAGPPVEVLVRLPGRPRPVPLADLLEDRGALNGAASLELRLGGHRANIPRWHSGCIVCLYSCPGSKLGNTRYTVRDYLKDETRFRARTDLLPPDGTKVGIVVRLLRPS
ncbi:MAG TPA: YdjY domain-containing protein [Thermoanaerobaculia bacterium]